MGFMDKVKSTSGEVVSALTDVVNDVSNKGKEMSAKSKINKSIKEEETKINNFYISIGKKLFESNQTAPAGFEEQFEGINNAKAEIEKLQNELKTMAEANNNSNTNTNTNANSMVCPKCGKSIIPEQIFCQGCGTKLKD